MADIVKLTIEIINDSALAKVSQEFTDNSKEEKWISLSDVVQILNNSKVGNSYLDLGELPFGYVRGARDVFDASTFLVVMIYPAEKRILTYYGEEMVIPYPELLFEFKVIGGRVVHSGVFSVIHESGEDYLANYPFGNVYGSGEICWGSNVLPNVRSMKDIELIVGLFFGAVTNNDLYRPGSNIKGLKKFTNQKGLLCALEKHEIFPLKWLVKRNKTVNEQVESFFSKNM